ncbi:helix-turn-helix transcriptional regulator [Aquimarina sp. 2201CG1-2-11]|uniref:helix-turn-helix domain-containing protein n=1 Tax=Aquimarina discodermiae TaxID=3231043 RepID=UPI003462A40E
MFREEGYIFEYLNSCDDYIPIIDIYSVICCFISLKVLNKAQHIILHYHSNTDSVHLGWIKKMLIGALSIVGVDILFTIGELIWGALSWNSFYLIATGIVFVLVYLGYHGLMQSRVLVPNFLFDKHNSIEEDRKEPVISIEENEEKTQPFYNETEVQDLKQLLIHLMENEKPFLDPDLSLRSLAKLLEVKEKKLSAFLNQYLDISFYTYINEYRVNEVKEKLSDPANNHLKILAIAYDCGFNSKTSFNRIFKNTVGTSPSLYKKQFL